MAKLDEFYKAVGRFVITWAELELYLDLLLLVIRKQLDQDTREASVPHQLSAKVRFIRRSLNAHAVATDQRDALISLLDEIDSLADTRHDFVHGALIHGRLLRRGQRTLTFGRLLQPAGRPRRSPVRVTATHVNEVSDRLWEMSDELLSAAERISKDRPFGQVH